MLGERVVEVKARCRTCVHFIFNACQITLFFKGMVQVGSRGVTVHGTQYQREMNRILQNLLLISDLKTQATSSQASPQPTNGWTDTYVMKGSFLHLVLSRANRS